MLSGVRVGVDHSDADLISGLLWAYGPTAIGERDEDGRVWLTASFEDPEGARRAAAAVDGELIELDPAEGLDAWRRHARPQRAGAALLVPAWLAPPPLPDGAEYLIRLDPGRAFGGGTHPTTRLTVELVLEALRPGQRVLDVGTGSGVVAVAAAMAGAGEVVAVDIDPEAPPVARANAELNRVADRIEVLFGDPLVSTGPFDLVAANLLPVDLRPLVPAIVERMAPGARLVVSGFLTAHPERILPHLPGPPQIRLDSEQWSAVTIVTDP